MYSNKILELFKSPINCGGLQGANGVGKYIDPECNDNVKIYLKIDENANITDAKFKALGGVGTIAAASALCSCLLDCTIEEAKKIDADKIYEVTGAYPEDKVYSINFALNALNNAIEDYYNRLAKEEKKQQQAAKEQKVEPEKEVKEEAQVEKKELTQEAKEEANQVTLERRVSSARANFDAMFEE